MVDTVQGTSIFDFSGRAEPYRPPEAGMMPHSASLRATGHSVHHQPDPAFRAFWPDLRAAGSDWARVQAAHVVGEVFHLDLGLCAHYADRTEQRAAHVVGLRTDHVLNPRAHR